MTCVVCRIGQTRPGRTTVTLERAAMTLVFKGVPAQVCRNCGEAYVDEETTRKLMQDAEEAAGCGVQVDIREFASATR
jgi:YgiT-type zinc finger domain-containing protein